MKGGATMSESMRAMTVELLEETTRLQRDLYNLIADFERKTGVYVHGIDVMHVNASTVGGPRKYYLSAVQADVRLVR